jgi:hypothetical protein
MHQRVDAAAAFASERLLDGGLVGMALSGYAEE